MVNIIVAFRLILSLLFFTLSPVSVTSGIIVLSHTFKFLFSIIQSTYCIRIQQIHAIKCDVGMLLISSKQEAQCVALTIQCTFHTGCYITQTTCNEGDCTTADTCTCPPPPPLPSTTPSQPLQPPHQAMPSIPPAVSPVSFVVVL